MKRDKSGFWKAICEHPDDDTPRLVFADFLDDQGQEARAEFIRVQCEIARLEDGGPESWPRRVELEIRVKELLLSHRAEWEEELPKWIERGRIGFRRGFPFAISASASRYARHGSALASRYARHGSALASRTAVQDVFFWGGASGLLEAITASPHLPRLLRFGNNSGSFADLSAMLPRMTALQDLTLHYPCRGDAEPSARIAVLLAIPAVRRLRRLELNVTATYIPPDIRAAALTLADADLPSLSGLTLHADHLTDDNLTRILNNPFVSRLSQLTLYPPLTPGAGARLAELSGLKRLQVNLTPGHGGDLAPLLACRNLPDLVELRVGGLDDEAAALLADSPLLGQVRSLGLSGALSTAVSRPVRPLTTEGLRRILDSGRTARVVRLRVEKVSLAEARSAADRVCREVARCPHLSELRHLLIGRAWGTGEGLAALAESRHLAALKAVSGTFTPPPLPPVSFAVLPPPDWSE